MAIGSGVPYNIHTGNGVTRTFAYGFTLLDAGDLVVTVDGVLTSSYTIAGIGSAGGGSITFSVAPASGAAVLLLRVVALVRATSYQTNGDLQAVTVNDDFDRLWLALQGLAAGGNRAIRVADIAGVDALTETAEGRADRLIGFSDAGAPELSPFTRAQIAALLSAAAVSGTSGGQVNSISGVTVPAGDTVVTIPGLTYTPGVNALLVVADGMLLRPGVDFTETGPAQITLAAAFAAPTELFFMAGRLVTGGVPAESVSVADAGGHYAAGNVETVLQEMGPLTFKAPWYITKDSPILLSLRHSVSGNILQQWQDGSGGTATYFYRGLSIQTDSHSAQMAPATNGGACDLLWQRSTANADSAGNRFNVTFEEAQDRLLISYATSASGAPAFDSAIQIYAGTSPQLLFPGIAAQFNVGVGVKQRAAGGFECRLVPTSSTIADLKQIGGSGTTFLRMSDGAMGFFGSGGTGRPTVAGSRGGNAALESLLSALAGLGLITNSTTV